MAIDTKYSELPANATLKPVPFEIKVEDATLEELKTLLNNAKFPKDTFENQTEDGSFGVSKGWVQDTVEYWATQFNWREAEAKMNKFPHFKVDVKDDDGITFNIHFMALFSQKSDAIPIVFSHGWPGSFAEFLGITYRLAEKYTPETLPYHVIVPSLPGFTFSELPNDEKDLSLMDVAKLFHKLVTGLGFDRYIAQGGDLGSGISSMMGTFFPECKAVHLNASLAAAPDGYDMNKLTEKEKAGVERGKTFSTTGTAYALMHGTRSSTIGIVLSSSPVALLAWVGEKFVTWSDETPCLDDILESVTLYWVTNTFPSSIYAYRQFVASMRSSPPKFVIPKPLGFSYFPKELSPKPKDWVAETGQLVFFGDHDKGGHFAALEEPEALLKDVEEFVAMIRDKI